MFDPGLNIRRTYGNVVDPDEISSGKGESITTPDVLMVQVADLNVLNNNVLTSKGQTLALDDTLVSDAKKRLVGSDLDALLGCLGVSDSLLG